MRVPWTARRPNQSILKEISPGISLGLTGWISLQSKGLSRVFSNTTVQKHQFLVLSFLYSPTLISTHDYWKTIALTRWTFVGKVMSLLFNSMESSRQEYWSRLPFPSPGGLPNSGIEPRPPTLQADSLPSEPPGEPRQHE